jgi:chromosome segregation ATPase
MYLRRLELQGFKTFAAKTVLEFTPESAAKRGITGVVGPNGSGKSNIADAIRWVMGEQSMKLLRGKKSEDVIFSGSTKKARSGFAEVSMTLVSDHESERRNQGGGGKDEGGESPIANLQSPISTFDGEELPSEIVVTRRLFRDGTSEYEINRRGAKLGEVQLLLAQCGIGQRTYSVIGQGMVDAVLSASPAERKEFFDEAAGLRPFQLKRHQAVTKLDTSRERLAQAEALLREIAPRLSSLERQVKRLEQRDALEKEKEDLERAYYGGTWRDIAGHLKDAEASAAKARAAEERLTEEAKKLEGELERMEKDVPPSTGFETFRADLDRIAEERAGLLESQAKLRAQVEIAEAKRETQSWSPLPLSKIIERVESAGARAGELVKILGADAPDVGKARTIAAIIAEDQEEFLSKLQRPAPEAQAKADVDPAIAAELESVAAKIARLAEESKAVQAKIDAWKKSEEGNRAHLFETQHELNRKRTEAREAEHKASAASVELARWETRRDAFLADLREHRPDLCAKGASASGGESRLDALAKGAGAVEKLEEMLPRLTRVRSQLEWIGAIDPQTQREHEETKSRFDFLNGQVMDLSGAIRALDTVIAELDETIRARSDAAFHVLNSEFGKTFKILFGGGEAELIQVAPDPTMDEEGNLIPPPEDAPPAGIDIQATPPGKRLKAIALLSGGERALTSIALISAIMATNPSPFIVLDEVDAALDESNTKKFAEILSQHAAATQFIVVTHNRTTMEEAGVLYGVTMTEDGTSKILSVRLEEYARS